MRPQQLSKLPSQQRATRSLECLRLEQNQHAGLIMTDGARRGSAVDRQLRATK